MDVAHRDSALRLRASVSRTSPAAFRAALAAVPPQERDRWLDLVLDLDGPPPDGPELPRGCVPYLPCSVDAVLRALEAASVRSSDVFVDIGAGVGRALALAHLCTGAAAIGLEIQPRLVDDGRRLARRLGPSRLSMIHGDAAGRTGLVPSGSVFFLYCPFSGARLDAVLADLEAIARARPIRVCCVDLPLPPCPWLVPVVPPGEDLAVYRSTAQDRPRTRGRVSPGPASRRR